MCNEAASPVYVLLSLDLITLDLTNPMGRIARNMATQTQTQRRASAKKAAATRKRNASRSTASRARTTAKTTATSASTRAKAEATGIQAVALQAERVVLIPFGAALIARDNVVEGVKPFTSRTS